MAENSNVMLLSLCDKSNLSDLLHSLVGDGEHTRLHTRTHRLIAKIEAHKLDDGFWRLHSDSLH